MFIVEYLSNMLRKLPKEVIIFVIISLAWFLLWLVTRKKFAKYGVSIYPFAIIIRSEKLRKIIMAFSYKHPRFVKYFSMVGLIISIPTIFYSLFYLLTEIIKRFHTPETTGTQVGIFEFLKIPLPQLIIFVFVLTLSVLFHEFSHGVSCSIEGEDVKSVGIFYIFPFFFGGYVVPGLDPEELIRKERGLLKSYAKMVAAGLFTTFLLTVIAFSLLVNFNIAISPFFEKGKGALITRVVEGSPAWNKLHVGDVIIKINNTKITSPKDVVNFIRNASPNNLIVIYLLDRTVIIRLGSHPSNSSWGYLGVELFQYYKPKIGVLQPIHAFYIYLVFFYGYTLNFVLLIFNAIPIFIFDGGKVLWAILNMKEKLGNKLFNAIQALAASLLIVFCITLFY